MLGKEHLDLRMPDLLHTNLVGINLFIYSDHLLYRGCGVRYYVGSKNIYAMILADVPLRLLTWAKNDSARKRERLSNYGCSQGHLAPTGK